MRKAIKRNSALQKAIPAYLAKPVGQIIVKWAFLEYRLSMVVWKILGVSPEAGRLAVSDPRAKQKLETIRDLLFLRGHEMEDAKFKLAYDTLDEISDLRDQLAHGVWTSTEGKWHVVKFGGKLEDQTIHKIERKRRIRPEAFLATPHGMATIIENIDGLIRATETFDTVIASLDKAPKQSGAAGRKSQARKNAKHPRLRKSSPK